MSKALLTKDLAKWIDTKVIAEVVIEKMNEHAERPKEELTIEHAKAIWLNFLETELNEGLDGVLKYGSF